LKNIEINLKIFIINFQLMRKIIAKDLGYENKFDWKKEKFIENINSTIIKFTKVSDKNG